MKVLQILFLSIIISSNCAHGQKIKPKKVKAIMEKVADWQIEHFKEPYSHRKPHHPLDWENAALYIGMLKWAEMAGPDKYYNWLKNIGEENQWKLHEKRIYHADDHALGQMYIDLYQKYNHKEMIKTIQERYDFILYHPATSELKWRTPYHQDRWNWCDALFMSPPTLAKLYKVTGDQKYLDFMIKEYKATTDFLFDKEENLYYRDSRFFQKKNHGTKVFWARGNGWVFAGLVNILNELKPNTSEYTYFLGIYKKMAQTLLKIQTNKGHWAMSLLGEKYYPTPETSGSSFFIYGLAWGINQGILDKKEYEPAVKKGWNAMVSYVTKEGMLGYVQPVGAAPGEAWLNKTEVYGTGAFLSAGTEIYKLFNK